MIEKHVLFEPKGYKFFDQRRHVEMMLIYEGDWDNWIAYKHPDGQWVTLRKATDKDISALAKAMSEQLHSCAFPLK